jgi:hypothetical protein
MASLRFLVPRSAVGGCVMALVAVVVLNTSFGFFDVGWASVRSAILTLELIGLGLLLLVTPRPAAPSDARLRALLVTIVMGGFAGQLALGLLNIATTFRTGALAIDQAEDGYRAAQLLARGEDPYGQGVLLDPLTYLRRLPALGAAGAAPALPADAIVPTLERYWRTLDPALGRALVPDAPGADAQRERAVLGYKYGPALVCIILPAALMLGPAAVPLLNLAATGALYLVLALLLRERIGGGVPMLLGFAALALDIHVAHSFVAYGTTDVWPLLFGAAALLAERRGAMAAMGAALALAIATKLVPGVLFLPLLLRARSGSALAAFTAVMVLAFGPFALWDGAGLVGNLLRWPLLLIPSDGTSWVGTLPASAGWAMRAVLGLMAGGVASYWAVGPAPRVFWPPTALALLVALAGAQFHNNYVPWFSLWLVLSVMEAFFIGPPPARHGGVAQAK